MCPEWLWGPPSLLSNGYRWLFPPQSSAEVKNAWSYTSTPQYVFIAWCLVKHRDNFTFLYSEYFTGWKTGSRSPAMTEIFSSRHCVQSGSGTHLAPIQWVPGALTLDVNRLVRKTNHSHPSSVEVKNSLSYTSTLQYVFMMWCLIKQWVLL